MTIEDTIGNETGVGVIDCTITPRIPKRLELVRHRSELGRIIWDPSKVRLLKLDPVAKSSYKDVSIRKEMEAALNDDPRLIPKMWKDGRGLLCNIIDRAFRKGEIPLTANVLDYLLEHQEVIPSDWKDKNIIFIGSLYKGYDRDHYSNLLARSLYRNPRYGIKEAV